VFLKCETEDYFVVPISLNETSSSSGDKILKMCDNLKLAYIKSEETSAARSVQICLYYLKFSFLF
jgi:hypothetical protein